MTYADLRCGISPRICGFAIGGFYPKYIWHEIKEELRASKDDIPGCRFNSRKPGGGNKLNHRTKTQACRILYAFIPASFGEKNLKKEYILVVKYANGRKDFRLLRIRTVQYLMM